MANDDCMCVCVGSGGGRCRYTQPPQFNTPNSIQEAVLSHPAQTEERGRGIPACKPESRSQQMVRRPLSEGSRRQGWLPIPDNGAMGQECRRPGGGVRGGGEENPSSSRLIVWRLVAACVCGRRGWLGARHVQVGKSHRRGACG